MKIVIAGGSGFLGALIANHVVQKDHVTILTRGTSSTSGRLHYVHWDGQSIGSWISALHGADVLINLAGRSVNCRYTEENRKEILNSRLDSTRVLGEALQKIRRPPSLWIQSSSATFYRHSEKRFMDEYTGETSDTFSEQVCQQWEEAFNRIDLPRTRKVILRTGIVLNASGSALTRLINLTKFGLGGKLGDGRQFISWIHYRDVLNIVDWIIANPDQDGIFNVVTPQPVRNGEFMQTLREVLNVSFGLPMPKWLLEFGARVIGTETELILKSRKVYPQRLLDEGFVFEFPDLNSALGNLCQSEARKS